MGEVRSVYGESRLHEPIRRNTKSAGPGGFYARWINQYPDTIEATGDDALYAHITFASGAIGTWVNDHAGHGKGFGTRQIWGSKGSLESPGDRNGRPVKLHFDGGKTIEDESILDYAPSYKLSPLAGEEGRADLALNYAPFEAGRLGRPVTLDEVISGQAYVYQGEIDAMIGLR